MRGRWGKTGRERSSSPEEAWDRLMRVGGGEWEGEAKRVARVCLGCKAEAWMGSGLVRAEVGRAGQGGGDGR